MDESEAAVIDLTAAIDLQNRILWGQLNLEEYHAK